MTRVYNGENMLDGPCRERVQGVLDSRIRQLKNELRGLEILRSLIPDSIDPKDEAALYELGFHRLWMR